MVYLVVHVLLIPLALILLALVLVADGLAALLGRARRLVVARSVVAAGDRRNTSRASIIIVNWNGRELLAQGLPSVVAAVERAGGDHEIIVVDNGSDDGSVEFVRSAFPTVKVIALERNLGFGEGNNLGVRAATSDIVVLLNNDMVVDPDFLPPLLCPFTDDRVFAVSSQIFMDGGEQARVETGLTRARLDDGVFTAWHARVNSDDTAVQPCLWAGGGSAAYDRKLFLALGGFDPLYAPFYVEDVDLSYRAWKRGRHVLFAPQSIVHHRHRASTSRFGLGYVEQAFAKNCRLFVWRNITDLRWTAASILRLPGDLASAVAGRTGDSKAILWALRQLPAALWRRWTAVFDMAHSGLTTGPSRLTDREVFQIGCSRYHYKERFSPPPSPPLDGRKKILMTCPYLPVPPTHGGAVRMLNLIKNLSLTNDVDVVSFLESESERGSAPQLAPYCRRLRLVLRQPRPVQDPLRNRSWYIEEFDTPEMHQAVLDMMGDEDYHVLLIEYTQMAHYHHGTRRSLTVLDEVDVFFRSFYRQNVAGQRPARWQAILDYLRLLRFEVESCRRFDRVLAMSAADAACLADYVPERRHLIVEVANGVDTDYYTPPPSWPGGSELLFVGSYRHTPNRDGLIYFLRQVFPLLQQQIPEVHLTIVGDGPWSELSEVATNPSVTATGMVDDTRPYLARCAVSVAPILSGAGTRIKILEALAAGIPIVSTSVGCEGIDVRDGEHILIADTPADFAAATLRILRDRELAETLRRNGRRLVEEKYDWRAIVARLDRLMDDALRHKEEVITPVTGSLNGQ